MTPSVNTLLGGRYKLSGDLARVVSAQRAWDRWLHRPVFIKIFARTKIDGLAAKRRFIESAQALVRIDQANLLDYGATEDGAPYHVIRDEGLEHLSLADAGALSWARVREVLLDVIAGVDALHCQRIVHGNISLHSVALIGDTARLVDFGDASVAEHELSPEQVADDVRGVAALGFRLLTGGAAIGRSVDELADALAKTDAPSSVRATLLEILTGAQAVELGSLRRDLDGDLLRARGWGRSELVSAAATMAAALMLVIGLWSSFASFEATSVERSPTVHASSSELMCEAGLGPLGPGSISTVAMGLPMDLSMDLSTASADESTPSLGDEVTTVSSKPEPKPQPHSDARFDAARASVEVGSTNTRKPTVVQTRRFDVDRDLSPALLVERGIDLTHGRPAAEDDPRLPVVDGPKRARALFEAACEQNYGKGCHMLGVQIAEGMTSDESADPAHYYRRGCALDYHRSCAALADLARAGEIIADVSLLDAKACLLAGPTSSYCLPK